MQGRTITAGKDYPFVEEKKSTTIVLGYGFSGVACWIISMLVAQQLPVSLLGLGTFLMLSLIGAMLMALGLLARKYGQYDDKVIFLVLSILCVSLSAILLGTNIYYGNLYNFSHHFYRSEVIRPVYFDWFTFIWGIIFSYIIFVIRPSDISRILLIALLAAASFVGAVAGWWSIPMLKSISSYLILIAAICSSINAISLFILFEMKKVLP